MLLKLKTFVVTNWFKIIIALLLLTFVIFMLTGCKPDKSSDFNSEFIPPEL